MAWAGAFGGVAGGMPPPSLKGHSPRGSSADLRDREPGTPRGTPPSSAGWLTKLTGKRRASSPSARSPYERVRDDSENRISGCSEDGYSGDVPDILVSDFRDARNSPQPSSVGGTQMDLLDGPCECSNNQYACSFVSFSLTIMENGKSAFFAMHTFLSYH